MSTTANYARQRDVAVKTARRAARVIRHYSGRLDETDVREKGTHDLVTKIDEDVQQMIAQSLTDAFPDYDVLAEEGTDVSDYSVAANGYRWIVDPIDGTTNFTHGVPPYAVSIALQHEGDIVVGVVLDVARRELFTATRGGGTYVDGVRAHVSRTRTLNDSLLTTGFPYRSFAHLDQYLDVLRQFMHATRGIRRPGAASVDLAYIACGRFDGFFETGLSPWDVAAGSLLVEEAGGRATDFHNDRLPLFERQILATNGLVHEAMLEILSPLRDFRA